MPLFFASSRRPIVVVATALILACPAFSQTPKATPVEGPDPREIPLPPIKTTAPAFPTVDQVPVRTEMPDVLTFADGTKVTTRDQWQRRREEMKRLLAHYAVGRTEGVGRTEVDMGWSGGPRGPT